MLLLLACASEPAPPSAPAKPPSGEAPAPAKEPAALSPRAEAPPGAPDVVLVVLDTVRPDFIGAWSPGRRTPFLDLLASGGAAFDRAWSTSSWTAPATASMMTGLYPRSHGVLRGMFASRDLQMQLTPLLNTASTLAERFQAAGWETFAVAANVNINETLGFDRGFDHFVNLHLGAADQVADRFRRMARRPRQRPRFVYLHLNDAHSPYRGHSPWYEETGDREKDAPSAYASEITWADVQLNSLFSEMGWRGGAVVSVVSDHGEEFGEHGGEGHGFSLHGELTRVAWILDGPGIDAMRIRPGASLVDLAPTLLELAGLAVPEGLDGISWATALRGGALPPERALIQHRVDPSTGAELWAITQGDLRTISGKGSFDLRKDPGEAHALPEDATQAAALAAWKSAHPDRSRPQQAAADAEQAAELRTLGYVED